MLAALLRAGLALPPAHRTALIDPRLLGWLLEPQLVQRAEKELEDYGLQVGVCEREIAGVVGVEVAGCWSRSWCRRLRKGWKTMACRWVWIGGCFEAGDGAVWGRVASGVGALLED